MPVTQQMKDENSPCARISCSPNFSIDAQWHPPGAQTSNPHSAQWRAALDIWVPLSGTCARTKWTSCFKATTQFSTGTESCHYRLTPRGFEGLLTLRWNRTIFLCGASSEKARSIGGHDNPAGSMRCCYGCKDKGWNGSKDKGCNGNKDKGCNKSAEGTWRHL